MVVDVQPATRVHPGSDVLDDFQCFGEDLFYLVPEHRCGLDFKFGPGDAPVLGLVMERSVVLHSEPTTGRQRLLRVATRARWNAVIREHLGKQVLYIAVASGSDDGCDAFDFNADFAIEIYLAFHTEVYRAVLKGASEFRDLFALICNYLSYSDAFLTLSREQRRGSPKQPA